MEMAGMGSNGRPHSKKIRKAMLDAAVDQIRTRCSTSSGYRMEDLRADNQHNRVAFTLKRGEIANLFCCGFYGALCCPYNKWGVYIWLENNALKWEIQRESNACIHCCFSGICGMMLLQHSMQANVESIMHYREARAALIDISC